MKTYDYKGFAIIRINKEYQVYLQGTIIRVCKTLKECKQRINNQTI